MLVYRFFYFVMLFQYFIKHSDGSIPILNCRKPNSSNNTKEKKFLIIGKFIEGISGLNFIFFSYYL